MRISAGIAAWRAQRLRIAWLSLPLLLLLLVLIPFFARRIDPAQPSADPDLSGSSSLEDSTESDSEWETVTDTVRRGDYLSGLLLRNRLGMQDIGRVLETTRRLHLFDTRTLQPGQTLVLERDEYGALRRLTFTYSPEEIYVYEVRGDAMVAWQQPVAREVRLRKFEGRIDETVDDAIRDAGGDYRLTLKFADVFAYDVDFLTEVQRGDRFSLLVEERFADGHFLGYGDILYGRYEGQRAAGVAVCYRGAGATQASYYDLKGRALKKSFLRAPLNFRRISSYFCKARFHPILKIFRPHNGIDYAAASGTPVVAVADGGVAVAGWKGAFGRFVELRHAGGTTTRYGHLSRIAPGVRVGSRVSQGQVIGYVGSTGLATGPHLHYEMVQNGASINPLTLRNLPAEPIRPAEMEQFADWSRSLEELEKVLLAGQVLEEFQPSRLQASLAQLQSEAPPLR
jgi:murein DD-endopeptidase MepM/ murein hydrolase activator NlpD